MTTTTLQSKKKQATKQLKDKQPSDALDDEFHSFVMSNQSSIGLLKLHNRCERIHRLRNQYWAIRERGVSLNINEFDSDKWYTEWFVAKDSWIPTSSSESQLTSMENRVAEIEKKILKNEGNLPIGAPVTDLDRELIENEIVFEKQIRKEFHENAVKVFDLFRRYQLFPDRDLSFEQSLADRPEFWAGGELFLSFSELVNDQQSNNSQMSYERHIILPDASILCMVHCPQIRPGFFVGKFEVTREQWGAITGTIPGESKLHPIHPVSDVSMGDIEAFLRVLNRKTAPQGLIFRLPTREEWSRACAAGSKGRFGQIAEGFEGELFEMGWYKKNGSYPHYIGEKEPNVWGLYDMHGNVWERTKELTSTDTGSKKSIVNLIPLRKLLFTVCGIEKDDSTGSFGRQFVNNDRRISATTVSDNRRGRSNSRIVPGMRPVVYQTRKPRESEFAPYTSIADPVVNEQSQSQLVHDNSLSIIKNHGWKLVNNQTDVSSIETGVAGGSFKSPESECFISSYFQVRIDFTGEDVGFRLVAERKKQLNGNPRYQNRENEF